MFRNFSRTNFFIRNINNLGVISDSKLLWNAQIAFTSNKSKKSHHASRLIKSYMTKSETIMLVTSNFYAVLYYGSPQWSLNSNLMRLLKSTSATALKLLDSIFLSPFLHYLPLLPSLGLPPRAGKRARLCKAGDKKIEK